MTLQALDAAKSLLERGKRQDAIGALIAIPAETYKEHASAVLEIMRAMTPQERADTLGDDGSMVMHRLLFFGMRKRETVDMVGEFGQEHLAQVFGSKDGLWPLIYYVSRAEAGAYLETITRFGDMQKAKAYAAPHAVQQFVDKDDAFGGIIMRDIRTLPAPLQSALARKPGVAFALSIAHPRGREVGLWQEYFDRRARYRPPAPL